MDTVDTVISFGGNVKAISDDTVGGYLVRFTSERDPDLVKDFFTRATDFDLDFPGKSSVYYDHGLDKTLKKRRLARATLEMDEAGVWAEAKLAERDEYEAKILELARAGKLGWSSGTAMHLVEREKVGEAHKITRWPLGLDASLTPTPAEPRNTAIVSVKSYLADRGEGDDDDGDELLIVEAVKAAGYDPTNIADPRTLEKLLRDVGLSRTAAKAIVASGYRGLDRCDAGERVTERDRLELELIRSQAQKRQRITECQTRSGP